MKIFSATVLFLSVTVTFVAFVAFVLIPKPPAATVPTPQEIADGPDPIASLSATVRSNRWGRAYWTQEVKAQTPTWMQAKTLCSTPERADYPNCSVVRLVALISSPRPPVPKYGTSPSAFSTLPEIKP